MSLKKAVLANYLGQGWTAVMGIAFVPLYIKYLGMEAYGLIGVFTILQAWLSLLDMGMTPTLNREMARFTVGAHSSQSIHDLLRSLEILCLGIAVLIVISVWTASDWLVSDWLRADKLPASAIAQAVSIMGLISALRFIESIYHGSLFGLQQQVWYGVTSASLATIRSGGAVILLVLVSPTIQIFFLWQAFFSLLSLAVYAAKVHKTLPRPSHASKFSRNALIGIWKFAGGMIGITFLSLLLTQVDKVLLSRLITLESFGYYALAGAVTTVLNMVIVPIDNAVYPRMVRLVTLKEQDELVTLYHQSAQLITVLTAPAALLLMCFSGGVIYMWSGNLGLTANTAPILSVLALGTFLNGLMHIPYQLQLAHGWTRLAINTNIVAVISIIPAIFWVVPYYGAVGAAWAWAVLNAGYILISMQFMHRRLIVKEKLRWYLHDILAPTAGAAGVVLLAQQFEPTDYQDRWHWFLFLLFTGCFALAASTVLASRTRLQLLTIMRRGGDG